MKYAAKLRAHGSNNQRRMHYFCGYEHTRTPHPSNDCLTFFFLSQQWADFLHGGRLNRLIEQPLFHFLHVHRDTRGQVTHVSARPNAMLVLCVNMQLSIPAL